MILAELAASFTVTDDATPYLIADVEITDGGTFWFLVDVDDRAAVAFAQRFQQLGVGIVIDGAPVPDREVGNTLTMIESADSYGDRLEFQLIGEKYSPFARALLRSKAAVEVSLVTGNTASEFRRKVFTGWVVASSFSGQAPAANVTCLDAAALHAEKRAKTWTLAPNSNRTRLSIGLELCALCSIPVGHVDLGGDGGTIRKPLAPGDQPILDFLRDFWGVLGAEIGFEDGRMVARRYDPSAAAVMDIHPGNILVPFSVAHAGTLDPNVLGVVSVSFSQIDPSGMRTVETRVDTYGPYARRTADGPMSETYQKIGTVITRTTFRGNLDVRTEQEEWGWYARLAAPLRIQTGVPFFEIVDSGVPKYTYPDDGSTRADYGEQFQVVRRSIHSKTLDADLNVIGSHDWRYRFGFREKAVWLGGEVDPTLSAPPTYINDNGDGVTSPYESFGPTADEVTAITIDLNADGTIQRETSREFSYAIGADRMDADGAFGYGVDSIRWASNASATYGETSVTTTQYRVISEDRYETMEWTRDGPGPARMVRTSSIGSPPRPERAEPETSSQEIRSLVRDTARIALAGEEIEDIEHNEYVETPEEAAAYALVRARRAGAIVLTCDVPIEPLAHKFRIVRVNLPGSSIDGLNFYVRSVTRDVASFRETIVADYYPPELG